MKGKIWATSEMRHILANRFNVGASTVSQSLNFKNSSMVSRNIRRFAANFLGCAVWLEESRFI